MNSNPLIFFRRNIMTKFYKSVVLAATLLALPFAHAAADTIQAPMEQKSVPLPEQQVKVTSWAEYTQKKADLKAQKKSKAITKTEYREKKKELKMAYKAHRKEVRDKYKAKKKTLKEEIKALKAKVKALKEEMKALKEKMKAEEKEMDSKDKK